MLPSDSRTSLCWNRREMQRETREIATRAPDHSRTLNWKTHTVTRRAPTRGRRFALETAQCTRDLRMRLRGCLSLLSEEVESLLNEKGVVLKNTAMPGARKNAQLCIPQPAGQFETIRYPYKCASQYAEKCVCSSRHSICSGLTSCAIRAQP